MQSEELPIVTNRVRKTPLTADVGKSDLEKTEITYCRPAQHRAVDLVRVDESDRHDSVEEFGVIFEDKKRDQFYEQNFKDIQDKYQRRLLDRHLIASA